MKKGNHGFVSELHLKFQTFQILLILNSFRIRTVLSDVITPEETFSYGSIKTGFSKNIFKRIKYGLGVEWNMQQRSKREKEKQCGYSVIHFEGEII